MNNEKIKCVECGNFFSENEGSFPASNAIIKGEDSKGKTIFGREEDKSKFMCNACSTEARKIKPHRKK